jgi:hypothetical protein
MARRVRRTPQSGSLVRPRCLLDALAGQIQFGAGQRDVDRGLGIA